MRSVLERGFLVRNEKDWNNIALIVIQNTMEIWNQKKSGTFAVSSYSTNVMDTDSIFRVLLFSKRI